MLSVFLLHLLLWLLAAVAFCLHLYITKTKRIGSLILRLTLVHTLQRWMHEISDGEISVIQLHCKVGGNKNKPNITMHTHNVMLHQCYIRWADTIGNSSD